MTQLKVNAYMKAIPGKKNPKTQTISNILLKVCK